MWEYTHYDELYHYGVPGMRWGVRRAERKAARAKRKSAKFDNAHDDYKRAHDKKSVSQMSDQELRERNNRLQMERQYASFNKKAGRGKKLVAAYIATAGTLTAAVGATVKYKDLISKGLDKVGEIVLKDFDIGNIKM